MLSESPPHSTTRRSRRNWIRRLPQIVKRSEHVRRGSPPVIADPIDFPTGLLALFGRRIAPTIQNDLREDLEYIPPAALQENLTNLAPPTLEQDRENIPPIAVQEDPVNTPPTVNEGPANTRPATAEENLVKMPFTTLQQQIPLEMTPYQLDWS